MTNPVPQPALELGKWGLVSNPIYPCYKAEGLCQVRQIDTEDFCCTERPGTCPFRKKPKQKEETGATT